MLSRLLFLNVFRMLFALEKRFLMTAKSLHSIRICLTV